MKVELIVPAVEENARIPNLALPILAGLSPTDVEISFTDDLLTPIDVKRDFKKVDLVGITVLSKTALRAYKIADAYRKTGIPVVLGGIHPTALPDEAKQHADSVVIGEAEGVWPRLIDDVRMGDLKPFYRQEATQNYQRFQRRGERFYLKRDIFLWMSFRCHGDVPSDANSAPSRNFSGRPTGSGPSRRSWKRFAVSPTGG